MLYEILYPWQKSIVDKFKNRPAFGLFLDMGLGKTILSLAMAEQNNITSLLVISVNSKAEESVDVDGSWLNWSSKFSIELNQFNKWSDKTLIDEKPKILLINYESTYKKVLNRKGEKVNVINPLIEEFIQKSKGQNVALILDESHKIKNLSSVQTKIIKQIQTKLKLKVKNLYTYLLSGTPFTQGYIDLYSQLKMLGYSGTKATFMENFCVRGRVPGLLEWQQPIVGYKNIDKLYETIHRYALTIMSDDVVELPEQIMKYHPSPITDTFKMLTTEKLYPQAINKFLAARKLKERVDESVDKKVNNPFYRNLAYPKFDWLAETTGTAWLRARQASIGFQGSSDNYEWFDRSRLENIKEFLKHNRENYVIFYNYTPELFELYHICEELKYDIDVYCGELKSLYFYEQYQSMTDIERINDKQNRVIIANFASGSTGMNWQLYNHCVITSVPLYKDFAQGIKRQHRLGQKDIVFYHIFYQNNWLDNAMLESLEKQVTYNSDMFDADLKKQELFD